MRRLLITTVLVLASLLGACSTAPDAVGTTTETMSLQTFEERVQYWINRKRVNHGRVPLRYHACTDKYSERWARYLAEYGAFRHRSLAPFFTDCGAVWAGEVIARGALTPREVVNAWMRSDGHRIVLMRRKARRVGVGVVQDGARLVIVANLTRLG